MANPIIFRKRYIPSEIIELKDDIVCYRDDKMLITRWKALKPRADFAGGVSVYLIDKGYKITRLFDFSGNLVFYYCDIIRTEYDKEKDTYTFIDLLADVIVRNDNTLTVLDLDELAQAYTQGLITKDELSLALTTTNNLLRDIDSKVFERYVDMLVPYIS